MLSEVTKSRIRMHLGVPAIGLPQTGSVLGWRYNNEVGSLEYRMINLQPIEEAQITGNPMALIQIAGVPHLADQVGVTIGTNARIPYNVTSGDLAAPIPLQAISQNWATAITLAAQGYLGDYGIPPQTKPSQTSGSYQGIVILQPIPPSVDPFSIVVDTTGNTIPYVAQQGVAVPPSVTFQESGITVYGYLAICDYLESRIANAADLVKYQAAGGAGGSNVAFRMNELAERRNIYDEWCGKLADFFGISRYPMGRPASSGSAAFTGSFG